MPKWLRKNKTNKQFFRKKTGVTATTRNWKTVNKHFEERKVKKVEEFLPFKDKPTVTWINIDGIHQVDIIETIGKHFGVHPPMKTKFGWNFLTHYHVSK